MKKITKKHALEMYNHNGCGQHYLVQNKDGSFYLVDHQFTELVKTKSRWEDKKYGFDTQNVFWKANCNYSAIVSWKDDAPFDVDIYLQETGWNEELRGVWPMLFR